MQNFNISTLKKKDFDYFINALKDNFKNLDEAYLLSLYQEFPQDFFIAKKGDEIIGFITAIAHQKLYGSISNLLILQGYRGFGYAKALLKFGIHHLGERQIALEVNKKDESFYIPFGFKSYLLDSQTQMLRMYNKIL